MYNFNQEKLGIKVGFLVIVFGYLIIFVQTQDIESMEQIKIFKKCTFLFVNYNISKSSLISLQNMIYSNCYETHDCVSLVYTYGWRYNGITWSTGKTSSNVASQKANRVVNKILYSTLSLQKHQEICLVRFPRYSVRANTLSFADTDMNFWLREIGHATRQPLKAHQSFALVGKHSMGSFHVRITVPKMMRLTFIFLSKRQSGVYTADTESIKCYHISEFCQISIILFTKSDQVFKNSEVRYYMKKWKEATPRKSKISEMRHIPDSEGSFIYSGKVVSYLLEKNYNCSQFTSTCGGNIRETYLPNNYRMKSSDMGMNMYLPFRNSILERSVKYIIIQQLNALNQFSQSLVSFLRPLKLFVWVCVLVVFVFGAICLKTGTKGSWFYTFFWLASTALEQETDGKNSFKKLNSTGLFVLVWLLSCNVLRNLYTSTLYSDIASDQDMIPLPSSLEDLFINSKLSSIYKALRTEAAEMQLDPYYYDNKNDKANTSSKPYLSLTSLIDRYYSYSEMYFSKGLRYFGEQSDNQKTQKQSFVSNQENNLLLVSTNAIDDYLLVSMLPILFSGRKLYENNENAIIKSGTFYKIEQHTIYTDHSIQVLGGLHGSGILSHLQVFYKALDISGNFLSKLKLFNQERNVIAFTYILNKLEVESKRLQNLENVHHTRFDVQSVLAESERVRSVSWKELDAVWKLYSILVGICFASCMAEQIYSGALRFHRFKLTRSTLNIKL